MLETYRKAIAAFLAGAAGLVAAFVPEVASLFGPEVLHAVSVVGATLAAYVFSNKMGGVNVNDLAADMLEGFRADFEAEAEGAGNGES